MDARGDFAIAGGVREGLNAFFEGARRGQDGFRCSRYVSRYGNVTATVPNCAVIDHFISIGVGNVVEINTTVGTTFCRGKTRLV